MARAGAAGGSKQWRPLAATGGHWRIGSHATACGSCPRSRLLRSLGLSKRLSSVSRAVPVRASSPANTHYVTSGNKRQRRAMNTRAPGHGPGRPGAVRPARRARGAGRAASCPRRDAPPGPARRRRHGPGRGRRRSGADARGRHRAALPRGRAGHRCAPAGPWAALRRGRAPAVLLADLPYGGGHRGARGDVPLRRVGLALDPSSRAALWRLARWTRSTYTGPRTERKDRR